MRYLSFLLLFVLITSLIGFTSCSFDELDPPKPVTLCDTLTVSFASEVMPIIQTNCAYSGCHEAGFAAGDFSTYTGLKGALDNGKMQNRVFDQKEDPNLGMPPNYAPAGNPQDLTDDELDILTCWVADGYPNN